MYENNAKLHPDSQIEQIANSIKQFGFNDPIALDEGNIIIEGHGRYLAALKLGMQKIPCIVLSHLTPAKKKAYIIAHNKLTTSTGYDEEKLMAEIEAIKLDDDFDFDLSEIGIDVLDFGREPEQVETVEDNYEIPDTIKTDIVLGDLFEIGQHRLLCGDSTKIDDVEKLMNGKKADMVFTDPPYDLENEEYHSNIFLFSRNAHVFVMHDDKGIVNYLRLSKLEFSRFYVANFGFSSPRGNDPYLSHILISQEKNGNAIPHKNMHDGFRSIIPMDYRFRLKDDKTEHKHQKPIKFISTFIEHFSIDNSLIFDLFLGSGSTMVAAHQLNRKCYGMELDPIYCQVIIDRMRKLDPTLEIKRNGEKYK